jgi:hypothetical protein
MRHVDLGIPYIGADIVGELVERNAREFGSARRRFVRLDLTTDNLPRVDLVLCRDALVHFSYAHIWSAIENIKRSGAEYLLTTTFVDRRNKNIPTGGWRRLNLEAPPFSFPQPLELIDEQCQPRCAEKHLALWRVRDLPHRTAP